MQITINGTATRMPPGATVLDAAAHVGVTPQDRGVAVAVASEVVPKSAWATTPIPDGAAVEVVRAAAGG